jgi:hypothetical protein
MAGLKMNTMKIIINKRALIWVLISAFYTISIYAQNIKMSSFWEQVDGKIINPPTGTPKSIGEIRLEGKFLINGSGAMLLLFGNRGLPAIPVPMWSYVSNDGGKSWEYLTPFTKYNGYEISTYDISSSGKNFITGSFNIGGADGKQPVYFFSNDGKNWTAKNKSDLLDKNYFGIGSRSIIEAKNRKLSDCLNLYPGNIGDYNAVYELHKIYYPDGSIRTVKDDTYNETIRSTNMANFYSFQSTTGTYVRGNPMGDYQVIREAYYNCEGKYFASLGSGVSMISDDDISYKKYTSGLFISTSAMREKYFPICDALFGMGMIPSNEIKLYVKTKDNDWEDTGYYSGVYSKPPEPSIKYNPKTKRFYIFKNFQFGYTNLNEEAAIIQSKQTYECDCYSENGVTPKANDDYSIVFYAYGPTSLRPKSNKDHTLETSPTGHIYVGFAKNSAIEIIKGLSPKDGILNMGKVDESTDESYLLGYHTHCFTVKVSKQQYFDALKLSKSYYFSPISDCVSYADDVAELLGLNTPNTTDVVLLPFTYLEYLKNNNKGMGTGSELCSIKPKAEHEENKNEKIEENASIGKLKAKYGTIKTLQGSNLNIRSEPSDKATIINKVPNGEKVTILGEDGKIVTVNGEKGKWLKIEYAGKVGWAWGNFIVKE